MFGSEFYGKPFGNAFDEVESRLESAIKPHRIAMIGDSFHTDILGGQEAGVKSALIADYGFFTGRDVARSIAASGIQPDYILDRP